jgi:ATP-dependent DNA helicase 2 subunit 2
VKASWLDEVGVPPEVLASDPPEPLAVGGDVVVVVLPAGAVVVVVVGCVVVVVVVGCVVVVVVVGCVVVVVVVGCVVVVVVVGCVVVVVVVGCVVVVDVVDVVVVVDVVDVVVVGCVVVVVVVDVVVVVVGGGEVSSGGPIWTSSAGWPLIWSLVTKHVVVAGHERLVWSTASVYDNSAQSPPPSVESRTIAFDVSSAVAKQFWVLTHDTPVTSST